MRRQRSKRQHRAHRIQSKPVGGSCRCTALRHVSGARNGKRLRAYRSTLYQASGGIFDGVFPFQMHRTRRETLNRTGNECNDGKKRAPKGIPPSGDTDALSVGTAQRCAYTFEAGHRYCPGSTLCERFSCGVLSGRLSHGAAICRHAIGGHRLMGA